MPISKENQGDLVSQPRWETKSLRFGVSKDTFNAVQNFSKKCKFIKMEIFCRNVSTPARADLKKLWNIRQQTLQLDTPGLEQSKLVSKGFFGITNRMWGFFHVKGSVQPPPPLETGALSDLIPLPILSGRKKMEIFYQEPKPVLILLISSTWFPNSWAVGHLSSHPGVLLGPKPPQIQWDTRLGWQGPSAGADGPGTQNSSQELQESPQALHVSSRAGK